jgi:hypothetical protein
VLFVAAARWRAVNMLPFAARRGAKRMGPIGFGMSSKTASTPPRMK